MKPLGKELSGKKQVNDICYKFIYIKYTWKFENKIYELLNSETIFRKFVITTAITEKIK